MSEDIKWMKSALALARRGLGNVAPNPAVGCLIVKDGVIVGRGWTKPGGRPHAETEALKQAGSCAQGATVYVTLEPCAHHGKTPPCADALIAAGVVRVVVATEDVDLRVSGKGLQKLRSASIHVDVGVLSEQASQLNKGFFLKETKKRPLFSLKLASSIDGKIATAHGESKWITGASARQWGHMLRAQHDAILVGVNTILADNPDLRCRINGLEHASPTRIILDSSLKTPVSSNVLSNVMEVETLIVTNKRMQDTAQSQNLAATGAQLIFVEDTRDISVVASHLADRGMTRVLVEGGGQIHASFLKSNMCDNFYHFMAPKLIGSDGVAGIGNIGLAHLQDAPHLKLVNYRQVGEDLLATYKNAE